MDPEQRACIFMTMLKIDLKGRRALVAGVADDHGFGWAIAKSLAEAGASVCAATWPPALNIFRNLLERGKLDDARRLSDGGSLTFERIYALDAAYDSLDEVPVDVRDSKRYRDSDDFTIGGMARSIEKDFGAGGLDIVIHSLANGPEVRKSLLDTTRAGYMTAINVSAYSMVSLLRHLGPLMRRGGATVSLTYLASERAIPFYGGGMSSAKAALESDTRMLAFEAGRSWGIRVNTISAGPYASRAASAIGVVDQLVTFCSANSPLAEPLAAEEVGNTAAFLCSDLGSGISGATIYVDKGYHAMGIAVSGPVPSRED